MKKTLLLILAFGAVAAFLIYCLTPTDKAPRSREVKEAPVSAPAEEAPAPPTMKALQWNGTVQPEKVTDVVFKVGGTLENGEENFQRGSRFRKNQLLFQVNNREAFLQMMEDKTSLQEKLKASLPDFETSASGKWNAFFVSLGPASLVADLPASLSAEEQKMIASKGIAAAYQHIKQQEKGMSDYFYIAPFDGILYERTAKAGGKIRKGEVVARIGKPGKLVVRSRVVDFNLEIGRVEVLDHDHALLTGGAFLKAVQDPRDKHQWDVYFTVDDTKQLKAGQSVVVGLTLK